VVLTSPRFAPNLRLQSAADNNPPLRTGETGAAVQIVQRALIDLGIAMPASTRNGGAPDGIYGPETARAVRTFQARHGLAQDGVAGRQTLVRLDQLFSGPPQVDGEIVEAVDAALAAGYQLLQFTDAPYWFWALRQELVNRLGVLFRAFAAYRQDGRGPNPGALRTPRRIGLPVLAGRGRNIGVVVVDDAAELLITLLLLFLILESVAVLLGNKSAQENIHRMIQGIREAIDSLRDLMRRPSTKALDDLDADARRKDAKVQECQDQASPQRQADCAEKMAAYKKALGDFKQQVVTARSRWDFDQGRAQVLERLMEKKAALDALKKCLGCTNF
jgi:peptidoglycan hydrolase-like protein with peptidoglycan-binding domain